MNLLTGAAGKTGQAILHALIERGEKVRVFVRTVEQGKKLIELGAQEISIGDLRDPNALFEASRNCKSIYYICPNVTPDEVEIGETLLEAARKNKVDRFVYHSVFHSQISTMPHHWQKMRMEEQLFECGMNYIILQPCAYMQNILSNWNSILEKSIYSVPYATYAQISIVDLEDVAAVAATVLTDAKYTHGIYELAGPQPLSQIEVAEILQAVLKIKVIAKTIDRDQWTKNARAAQLCEDQIQTLLKMFEYYEKNGLVGNPIILDHLLGRPATSFEDFVKRQAAVIQ
ncbi:MAG: NmrA family NAD(P)-binding protein [Chloroflexi bacterium]|nr:NmrA family NAD(P)-binding protein [Chloroflexota bacterium]